MSHVNPTIFVSCGQFAADERELGQAICKLITELRPDLTPYFADNQSTADGLSANVLNSLRKAAGFICVMHPRGRINVPGGVAAIRGSVWIEQEIAIVAFMREVLDIRIPVLFFKHKDVGLEGIRSVLLMNPCEFNSNLEILDQLRDRLPSEVFAPFPSRDVEPQLSFQRINGRSDGQRHVYQFIVNVKNVGSEMLQDLKIRVLFPKPFLNLEALSSMVVKNRSTHSHACLETTLRGRVTDALYPGDNLDHPLIFDYFVDGVLFRSDAMQSEIFVELFSGSMPPKKIALPFRNFQEF